MFKFISKLFAKKSQIERLYEEHKELLAAAHSLSTSNRKMSDAKYQAAAEIMKQIELLETKE